MKAVLVLVEPDNDVSVPELDRQLGARNWRAISLEEAEQGLALNVPLGCDILLVGVDRDDERIIHRTEAFVKRVDTEQTPIVLITANVSPAIIHRILSAGAEDFVPYPIPENALTAAIERVLSKRAKRMMTRKPPQNGKIISVFHFAGGAGATTLAVNLAWELASRVPKKSAVTLLDFDFQYGGVSSLLDLPERPAIGELFTQPGLMEESTYRSALLRYRNKLAVQTAPPEIIPLDAIDSRDIEFVLEFVGSRFEFAVIDMPVALTRWSEVVLSRSNTVLSVLKTDVRDARNMIKFMDTLKSEGVIADKLEPVINMAPGSFDFGGRTRVKKFEDGIGAKFRHWLPKGGEDTQRAADRGAPIADISKRNPLRAAIAAMAEDYTARSPADPARTVKAVQDV